MWAKQNGSLRKDLWNIKDLFKKQDRMSTDAIEGLRDSQDLDD